MDRRNDAARKASDRRLLKMEAEIQKIMQEAERETLRLSRRYFSAFDDADKEKRQAVEDGELTERQYKAWRWRTMCTGRKWNAFRNRVAGIYAEADRKAAEVVNDNLLEAYAESYNYSQERIAKKVKEHG